MRPNAKVGGSMIALAQPPRVNTTPAKRTTSKFRACFVMFFIALSEFVLRTSLVREDRIVKGGQGYVGRLKSIL